MYGGAKGIGAPKNNQNALKHGLYTEQAKNERFSAKQLVKKAQRLISLFGEQN